MTYFFEFKCPNCGYMCYIGMPSLDPIFQIDCAREACMENKVKLNLTRILTEEEYQDI